MATGNGEIRLPRRAFTDVHELIYLFRSWELILQAGDVPEILRPLQAIPPDLAAVMSRALADAEAQLESAQSENDIELRFPASKEFADLMRWGAGRLAELHTLDGEGTLDPNWQRALHLADDFVDAALEQLRWS